MPIDSANGPAWWVKTIFVVVWLGLWAGLEWGSGWWQNPWTAFAIGLAFALAYLVLYGTRPDRSMRAPRYYFGYMVFLLVFSALYFVLFFLRAKGFYGLIASVWLAMGLRYARLCQLASLRTRDDSGIESLHLNNHG